ncbi:MAG: cytochrome c oxidase subunit II [Alphaproteobacteria bacterium]
MGWFRTLTLAAGATGLAGGSAAAQDGIAKDWQLGLQEPASPVMHEVIWFHDILLMPIITVITLFVLALLLYIMFRFRESANPTPSKTTHNTLLEVIWTAVPILILVVIAIPSFKLLYMQDKAVDADMTIKAIGNQWYWTYEYPDHGNFVFDANMIPEADLKDGQPRLLATDNEVVVPVNKTIRMLLTATDVIHNWAIPAFSVKLDAVPGRTNETWFLAEREGVYYGQCSELCGVRHGFMPITVRVVSEAAFATWVAQAQERFAAVETAPRHLAAIRDQGK